VGSDIERSESFSCQVWSAFVIWNKAQNTCNCLIDYLQV